MSNRVHPGDKHLAARTVSSTPPDVHERGDAVGQIDCARGKRLPLHVFDPFHRSNVPGRRVWRRVGSQRRRLDSSIRRHCGDAAARQRRGGNADFRNDVAWRERIGAPPSVERRLRRYRDPRCRAGRVLASRMPPRLSPQNGAMGPREIAAAQKENAAAMAGNAVLGAAEVGDGSSLLLVSNARRPF